MYHKWECGHRETSQLYHDEVWLIRVVKFMRKNKCEARGFGWPTLPRPHKQTHKQTSLHSLLLSLSLSLSLSPSLCLSLSSPSLSLSSLSLSPTLCQDVTISYRVCLTKLPVPSRFFRHTSPLSNFLRLFKLGLLPLPFFIVWKPTFPWPHLH